MRSDKERFLSMALRRKKTAKRVALGMAATLAFTAMGNVPMVENGITVYAAEEMSDSTDANIKFIDNGDGTASITGYTGKSATFTIPTTVKSGGTEYNVTKIADQAFGVLSGGDSNFAPTSIIIPDTITYIGNSAFEGLTGITSITIGNGVTYVGSRAFYGLVGLTSISFPSSVANIGGSVCCGDTALKSVTIAGASSLGTSAFSGCAALETADLSGCSNLTVLPTETFYNCGKLKSVSLPSAISTIDASAFSGCKGLTSLSFPSGLTTIGEYAFNGTGITSLSLPSSVSSIGNGAFMYCSSLKDVKVKANVTTLPASLFEECVALETVNLPAGLKKINGSVFKNDISLKNISFGNQTVNDLTLTFPDTMESIGKNAFKMGTDTDTDADYEFKNRFSFINMGNGVSDVGSSAFEGFKANIFVSSPNMDTISDSICYRCGLTQVYIQEGAEEIGDWAFKDNSIEKLYFPSSITDGGDMGEKTFKRSDAGLITYIYTSKNKRDFNIVMNGITDLSEEGWYDVSTGNNLIPKTSFDTVKPMLDNGATDLGEEEVSVTGVSLDKAAVELTEGDTTTLTATVTPDNATNTDVTWSSNNPSVATVNAEGNVTAVAAGDAIITVTTVDEAKTATCAVTVTAKTTEIENFVDRLYTNLLHQSVDANGRKASFVSSLSTNEKTAAEVVAEFALDASIADISNEDFVSRMYSAVFNRNADEGKKHYENLLDNGMSRKIVIQKFTESQEFANICASYGMTQGKFKSDENRDSNILVTSFVNNLYLTILGRTPDIGETPNLTPINNFAYALINHASTDGIVKEFILGAEYKSKNYTNEEFIIACFRGILGRTETTIDTINGGKLFLDTLNARIKAREGIVGSPLDSEEINRLREEIVDSLLDSQEYKNRLYKYGLTK